MRRGMQRSAAGLRWLMCDAVVRARRWRQM